MRKARKILSRGFTMIELLVVIAVIAVLAVAVLSSLNPIEQINKGRDTRTRSDAAQLINATDRFFATQEEYPWNDDTYACGLGEACTLSGTNDEDDPAVEFPFIPDNASVCSAKTGAPGASLCQLDEDGGAWMDGLSDTAEIKGQFVTRVIGSTTYALYAYKEIGIAETLYICFRPSSLAFQKEALDNCKDLNIVTGWGGAASTLAVSACPSATGTRGTSTYEQSADKDELVCLP